MAPEAFKYLEQRRNLTALENADTPIVAWINMVPDRAFARGELVAPPGSTMLVNQV